MVRVRSFRFMCLGYSSIGVDLNYHSADAEKMILEDLTTKAYAFTMRY